MNIQVKEFKIKLNGNEYTFRLDFKALMKFENKFGKEGLILFNNFLQGNEVYSSIVKILSCSCVEKEFTEEELSSLLSFDFQTMKMMDEITFALIEGMIDRGKEGKNEETNQNNKKKE